MAVLRWDQAQQIFVVTTEVSWILESSFTEEGAPKRLVPNRFSPAVDIYETASTVVLSVELPGVENDEVVIEVKGDLLALRGERQLKRDLRSENCHRMERNYGSFQRLFKLSQDVDGSRIQAQFKDGLLDISIPKVPQARVRKVPIRQE